MTDKKRQTTRPDGSDKVAGRMIRAPLIQAGVRRAPGDVVKMTNEEAALLEHRGFIEPVADNGTGEKEETDQ